MKLFTEIRAQKGDLNLLTFSLSPLPPLGPAWVPPEPPALGPGPGVVESPSGWLGRARGSPGQPGGEGQAWARVQSPLWGPEDQVNTWETEARAWILCWVGEHLHFRTVTWQLNTSLAQRTRPPTSPHWFNQVSSQLSPRHGSELGAMLTGRAAQSRLHS